MDKFLLMVRELIAGYSAYAILIGLLIIFAYYAYQKIKKQTDSRFIASIFLIAFIGMGYVAFPTSTEKKREKDPIGFLRTDPEAVYLIDNGSYVSNNIVHLEFSTRLLPPTAMLFLDYIPKTEPAESTAYTNYLYGSVMELPTVIEFEFENAISNRWVFYTTYTPGPNVHTNGVAVAEFLKATKYDNVAVPKRSSIWENGIKIYPTEETVDLLNALGEEIDNNEVD